MKKWVYEFKNWLIKKLGGYTKEEHNLPIVPHYSHQANITPIPLQFETTLSRQYLERSHETIENVYHRFLNEVASKFAYEFIQRNLIEVSRTDDIYCDGIRFKAKMYVIDPENLKP